MNKEEEDVENHENLKINVKEEEDDDDTEEIGSLFASCESKGDE